MLERFDWTDGALHRSLELNSQRTVQEIRIGRSGAEPIDEWDGALLRGAVPRVVSGGGRGPVRIIDLFCGAGGLSLGVSQGLSALGYAPVVEFAADVDPSALALYDRNFGPADLHRGDVSELVVAPIEVAGDGARFTHKPWIPDRRIAARLAGAGILIGGPPCQGHSNLNNHTRRFDPRNELYLTMPAVAVALDIPIVIIENVREVRVDHQQVVRQTIELLQSAGYGVVEGVLSAIELGLPQTRNRYFLVAIKGVPRSRPGKLADLVAPLRRPRRNLHWAIGDLEHATGGDLDKPAVLSDENRQRIDYLFENERFELPNEQRPKCHRNGHTYRSVYGRLRWDEPAGTITTGFLTPGRGRYIHPSQRRALTPHEAARIQGFPDSFRFTVENGNVPPNKTLTKVIGDAVPPPMGFAAVLAAMRMRSADTVNEFEAAA